MSGKVKSRLWDDRAVTVEANTGRPLAFTPRSGMKLLSPEALTVLGSMEIQGKFAAITAGQLDRKLYAECNTALEAIGGVWTRQKKAHAFPGDPRDALDQIVLTGGFCDKKQEFGFFETPKAVVKKLIDKADLKPRQLVLEPSAGRGAIADELAKIVGINNVLCVELQPECVAVLHGKGFSAITDDFLTSSSLFLSHVKPDRIVMNPPFGHQQDIDHVTHAYSLLAPGGRLVSVMSAGVMFRENKKTTDFRKLLKTVEPLPDDSFKESGTSVRTVIVTLEK